MNRAVTISSFFLFLRILIEKQPSASVNPEIQPLFKEGFWGVEIILGIALKLKSSIFNLGAKFKEEYHLFN
jgi:hypothetical protein